MLVGDTPSPDDLNNFTIDPPGANETEIVHVSVDSQLQTVLQRGLFGFGGDIPITGGNWQLKEGDSPLTFDWTGVSDSTLQSMGLLNNFSVYGGAVTITETIIPQMSPPPMPDGMCPTPSPPASPPTVTTYQFDIYRYLNPVYAAQGFFTNLLGLGAVDPGELPFPNAVIKADAGASTQNQTLLLSIASDAAVTPTVVDGTNFSYSSGTVSFTPVDDGGDTDQLELASGVDIDLSGTGLDTQKIYVNEPALVAMITSLANNTLPAGTLPYTLSADEVAAFANPQAVADTIYTMAKAYYTSAVGNAADVESGDGTDGSAVAYGTSMPGAKVTNSSFTVGTVGAPYGSGIDNDSAIGNVVADASSLPNVVNSYNLAMSVNQNRVGSMTIFAVSEVLVSSSLASFESDIAETIAHEIGHTLGLVHISGGNPYNIQPVGPSGISDVMS